MGLSPVLWQFLVKWMTNFAIIPPEASRIAPQVDALLVFMTLVSLVGLVLVGLLVTYLLDSLSPRSQPGSDPDRGFNSA